jgi:hypothetical protein
MVNGCACDVAGLTGNAKFEQKRNDAESLALSAPVMPATPRS